MKRSLKEQTLAFSGVLQTGELVRQIATGGHCSRQSARNSIDSLFVTQPETTEAVFGGVSGIRLGLTMTNEMATRGSNDSRQAMAYASGLLRLAMLLRKDRQRQDSMETSLGLVEPAWRNADDALDPSVIAQLADIYKNEISTLPLRIQVHGDPTYLRQDGKVSLIRALLLAGIRAGFLWFQLGGRPWRLLFQRGRMFRIAAELAG